MKAKHQRLIFIAASMVFLCVAVLLTMRAFRDNLIFFYSPSDVAAHVISPDRTIRIGGLVQQGSVKHGEHDATRFTVTDGKASVDVTYQGILPSLFREGQGVVAEGHLTDRTHFSATNVLAKHDEKYMPPEVVDALKKSGHWQGEHPQ